MIHPLVSIIIPVYNVEKYLAKCIDSVLAQNFVDWELLLINDGSTDSSSCICDEYAVKDTRIKVFHQVNKGVSTARNIGIDNAKGEYITFIDSDDYIDPNYLLNFEIDGGVNNFDLISQGAMLIFPDKKKNHIIKYNQTKELNLSDFYSESVINCLIYTPWSKLYKTDIIKDNKIHFDETICYGEDRIFVTEYFSYCKRVKAISACGYNYMHENQNALTLKRHSGFKIYNFSLSHYQTLNELYKSLKITENIRAQNIYHNVCALFQSIILVSEDKSINYTLKVKFVKDIDKIFFAESNKLVLPKYYNYIRIIYNTCPKILIPLIIRISLIFKR